MSNFSTTACSWQYWSPERVEAGLTHKTDKASADKSSGAAKASAQSKAGASKSKGKKAAAAAAAAAAMAYPTLAGSGGASSHTAALSKHEVRGYISN